MTARRDPEGRRRAIVEAACALIPEVGLGNLTHRRVAARADVPLGATTYYFKTLDDLRQAALEYATQSTVADLRSWDEALRSSTDIAATLAALTEKYLADRPRALIETELYVAAIRQPELRDCARLWFDGLVAVISEHANSGAARAAVQLLDGVVLHVLSSEQPLETTELAEALRALLR